MAPHNPAPLPRKVEVDLSGILIRPEQIQPPGFGYEAQFPTAIAAEDKDWSINKYLPRLGSSGFANLIFAVGSCVLGLFCTLSIVDNLEHFRRIAHLPGDPIYRRPESTATTSQRFAAKAPNAAVSRQQPAELNAGLAQAEIASSDQSPAPSTSALPLMGQTRYSPLLANNDRLFDSLPNNSSSSGSSHEGGGGGGGGSGEGNGNGNGKGKHQTTADRSGMENPSRGTPKSIVSSRTKSSGGRQGLLAWLSGGLGISESDKSPPRVTRSAGGSLKSGGHNLHSPAATTQSVSARNAMSMHSGAGIAAMQSHPTVTHLQMQNGMLAQPGLARGLGGLNGGGLGGGGGGRHGGNAHR